ncbi:PQQ-dependent sugar dehydrogenase [Marinicella meishanensis]|uniref:PQQ-dependent sugar dehydrogenase n=1 Tax=Marinicella meishanensis TaxID=2873263 RepID=UPI001CBFC379|nr:PQQ-dependent sugar dehydrogenase [Marinicella sp. NBU2979]
MKKYLFVVCLITTPVLWAQPAFLDTEDVAGGFTGPISVTHAGDGSDRLFVTQQGGQIKVVDGGVHLPTAFLDISSSITSGGERGLLGLAFHPNYASNGYFYVNYTDLNGDTVIERYSVSAGDPNIADPASGLIILTFAQPFGAHNGGDLNFGPLDGYLYISSGDGSGDPMASQDLDSLLGKMLRIDVDGDDFPGDTQRNYAIPPDNPYVGVTGADEVWVSGLRNPWRFSFDRVTGDLFIGDVGEDTWEEFNHVAATSNGGENFGWPCFEGGDFSGVGGCDINGPNELPFAALEHDQPGSNYCTAVGGYRYRGVEYGGLTGWYLFTDWCDGDFFAARQTTQGWEVHNMGELIGGFAVTSMGEDEAGELYAVAWSGLLKITGPTSAPDDVIFLTGFESP